MPHAKRQQSLSPRRRQVVSVQQQMPLQLPFPSPNSNTLVADLRAEFAKITSGIRPDKAARQAFLDNKLHILETHPAFDLQNRRATVAAFQSRLRKRPHKSAHGPVPGGVGYGAFYNSSFKTNFATGTGICWDIICPNPPGGNVNTWLYLTATNRSALGVEALVAYDAQNQPTFEVFDWARYPASPWQTNIPFANLAGYFRSESAHGHPYSTLMLTNVTIQVAAGKWMNQVWLWNQGATRWDLVYQYSYPATLTQQTTGWVGSWGPIVETFQNSYSGTTPMGALGAQIISRSAGAWGAWTNLSATDSYIRTDNKGFHLVFLDPNYNWAVNS